MSASGDKRLERGSMRRILLFFIPKRFMSVYISCTSSLPLKKNIAKKKNILCICFYCTGCSYNPKIIMADKKNENLITNRKN